MLRQGKVALCALILVFFCVLFPASPARADKLVIPLGQKTIPAKAYYGSTALDAVIVQEGTESIGSKAFADSSLREIVLPASLKEIAGDAFDGCALEAAHAPQGSSAYRLLRDRGLITEYRALLIGEKSFGSVIHRNAGDVRQMKKTLGGVKGPKEPYGTPQGIFEITSEIDLDYGEIRAAIRSTFADTRKQDISVFFIATHGDVDGDGELEMPDGEYLPFDVLASWLNTYVKGKVFVILESCGSGSAIYQEGIAENGILRRGKNKEEENADKFLQKAVEAFGKADPGLDEPSAEGGQIVRNSGQGAMRKPKFYVLAASRHHEMSWGWEASSDKNSFNFFTRWLTDGIGKKGASPADTDGDGYLSLNEMYTYVQQYDRIFDPDTGEYYINPDTHDYYYQHVQRYPKDNHDRLLKLDNRVTYKVTDVSGNPHKEGSSQSSAITVRRDPDNSLAREQLTCVLVDGKAVNPKYYTLSGDGLVLTLKSSFLNTLSGGNHKVWIVFHDGEAEATLKVTEKPKPVPLTGDSADPALWILMVMAGLGGIGMTMQTVRRKNGKRQNE